MKAYRKFSQIATLQGALVKDGRKLKAEDLSIIENGSVVFSNEKILWVGNDNDFPSEYLGLSTVFFTGKTLCPELIDCHTHLVFGGNRANEYTMRLNGADYEAIARAGGGILHTMNKTNSATEEELFNSACIRIERIHSYGVGTIEIKSGYGLNFEKEYQLSNLIDRLKKKFAPRIQIKNTFMAAHAIPKTYKSSSEYLDGIVIPLLNKLASEKILDAVDIFHEAGYFSSEDTEKLFSQAKKLSIPVKSHADEFNDNKGALLAVKHEALSCEHLLRTGSDGIDALAKNDTVAVLLPGTGFFLGKPQANARGFLDRGVKVAIASDFNPGSCHCDNVLLAAQLAAPTYKMNLAELWAAITLNAASALGIQNQGAIIDGFAPRFTIFDTPTLDEITYSWGRNLVFFS